MRALLVVTALLVTTAHARAEGFAELYGGFMVPVADDTYTGYLDSGPKLGLRLGSMSGTIGGMLSADWSPINEDNAAWTIFGNALDVSSNRFRVLANVTIHTALGTRDKLDARFRLGAGIDIAHVTINSTIFADQSDTDGGLALEAGAGLWYKLGTAAVGGEVGLPISFHDDGSGENIDLQKYTSFDIDVLFGLRVLI